MENIEKWAGTNPWLGLASYTEGTSLYGRDKERIVLTDIIKNNLATIVFGKSGVGKSSLLGAGISPALREELYIPIKIRLVHNSDISYVEQIEEEVRKQVNCTDMLPASIPSLGLWDFFHRHSFTRMEDGEECTPVVILDQFEEIYTLTDEEHKPDIHSFFQELSSLLNDIKPDHIVEKEREYATAEPVAAPTGSTKLKIKRVASSAFSYNVDIYFRFVVCLREDKLYLLERNSANIPALKTNRFNLQALSVDSALEVITCPRPDLFTDAEATAIIDKLADMGDEGVRTLDPAILSLFLFKYFEKRGTANADNIFADYYSEATANISSESIAFLENHLLTLGGYRNQIPLDDALSSGVTRSEIDDLLKSVILRMEKRKGIDYIEFSHDRLCAEARKNREERIVREQTRKARKRMILSFFVFAISAAMLSVVLWLTFKYQTSEKGRLSEIQQKELLKEKNDSLALLDAMNKRQTDSLLVLNEKNLAQKQEIERQRDEINQSLQKQQVQNRLLKEQLAKIEEQQRELDELRLLAIADSIVIKDNIAGKLSERLPYTALSKASKLIVTGEINAEDVTYIKSVVELGNLKHLDLGQSCLVEGDTYQKNYDLGSSQVTEEVSILTFSDAGQLETVLLPQNIKVISSGAFMWATNLKYIKIPEGVTFIAPSAFSGCRNLSSIVIPNSVTDIGFCAFENCTSLNSLIIPSSVTSLDVDAFEGCSNLSSIIVDKGNPNYDSRNNCNALINSSTNELYLGCKNTIIPKGVEKIRKKAFSGCKGLTTVTIPNSVTSIGEYAFRECDSLKSITIPNSITSIEEGAFIYCNNLSSIIVEKDNTHFDSRNNCNALINTSKNELILGGVSTVIPQSVTSIGGCAFYGRYGLKSITIPNSITSIEEGAFKSCYNLIHIRSEIQDISNVKISENEFGVHDNCVWEVPAGKVSEYMSQPWWDPSWKISEDSMETYSNLGEAYTKVKDYESSDKYYQIVLEHYGRSYKELTIKDREILAKVQKQLGASYETREDDETCEKYYKLALENYEKLAATNSDSYREEIAFLQSELGVLYYNKYHNYEKSKKFFILALEGYEFLHKQDTASNSYYSSVAMMQNNLGLAYSKLNDNTNSEKYYRMALENREILFNKNPDTYRKYLAGTCWNLTLLYKAMKRDDEYDHMLTRSVELLRLLYEKDKTTNLNLAKALNQKAYQYFETSQYALAMTTIEEAISLAPEDANYYDSKGEFLLKQGKNAEALAMWNKVLELNPNFLEEYPDGTDFYNGLKERGLIEF